MFPDNSYGHIHVTSQGTLQIRGVQKEDAGYFVCSALSVAGSATIRAFLQVKLATLFNVPVCVSNKLCFLIGDIGWRYAAADHTNRSGQSDTANGQCGHASVSSQWRPDTENAMVQRRHAIANGTTSGHRAKWIVENRQYATHLALCAISAVILIWFLCFRFTNIRFWPLHVYGFVGKWWNFMVGIINGKCECKTFSCIFSVPIYWGTENCFFSK